MAGAAASPPSNQPQSRAIVSLHHEVARRHRGRPMGSKNKPKQPIIITRENPASLVVHAVEVVPGGDVSASVANFSRRLCCGVCVLSGKGFVANVTLCQGSSGSSVTLHGRFEILSLLGTFLPPPMCVKGLTIFLSGAQGQVIGGRVVRPLVAAGRVIVIVASFKNATFERFPPADEEDRSGGCQKSLRDCLVRHPLQFEDTGGFCGLFSSMAACPPEFYAWPTLGQLAEKK